ncbi:hypothetical protein Tco_0781689 [Tanacetum coccineum]
MDNPNITMKEYIRLEEEKARRRGKVDNCKTVTYGKIWDNEDIHDLGSVETEFPAIFFNDTLTSEATLSCEPTVSSLNNDEIDFRISFDESDDEDCTPTVSYFDDLVYFKDFDKEFPAIVYNDALTSKLDFLTEPADLLNEKDDVGSALQGVRRTHSTFPNPKRVSQLDRKLLKATSLDCSSFLGTRPYY